MSEELEIESSVRHLLNDLTTCTAAFVLATTANPANTFDRGARLQPILKSMKRLQQVRKLHPAKVTALVCRYTRDVADAHEALMDVRDRVGARNQSQVINLALEIRSLIEPARLMVLVPDEF